MPLARTPALLILQAGRRLTEVPPPVVATAEELGRAAGKAAASRGFDGSTPGEAYQRVLRGIEDGDPAVLDAIEPPAIGPAAGYGQDDLARDLVIAPGEERTGRTGVQWVAPYRSGCPSRTTNPRTASYSTRSPHRSPSSGIRSSSPWYMREKLAPCDVGAAASNRIGANP